MFVQYPRIYFNDGLLSFFVNFRTEVEELNKKIHFLCIQI